MPIYRHITNLSVPLIGVDLEFLAALDDYRIGQPLAPPEQPGRPPLFDKDLKLAGMIGLYTTRSALMSDVIQKKTGWSEPDKELGAIWRPF